MATPLHLKPPIAAWIVRERRRLGWKPKDIADRLTAMGLDVTEQTVKVWESNADRRPSPYNLEGLATIFGSVAPTPAAMPDQASLIAALEGQTAAINRLVERFDSLASDAIRQGVQDAFREAGGDPASGESLRGRHLGQSA